MITPPTLSPERDEVVTATDSTILLGAVPSSWGTAMDVWRSKMGIKSEHKTSPAMLLGHILEPLIIQDKMDQEDMRGFSLEPTGFIRSATHPMGCTPDAMASNSLGTTRFGLECKSTVADEEWTDDGIPFRVDVQVNHSMEVADLDRWDVSSYLMSRDTRDHLLALFMEHGRLTMEDARAHGEFLHYTRRRNSELCHTIVDRATAFWEDYVKTKRPPTDWFKAVELPAPTDDVIIVGDNEAALILQAYGLKEEIKSMTDQLTEITERIRAFTTTSPSIAYDSAGRAYASIFTPVKGKTTINYKEAIDDIKTTFNLPADQLNLVLQARTSVGAPSLRFDLKEYKQKKGKG